MIKEIILSLSMLLTVQYCTYNEDNGVFEEIDDSELTEYNTGLPRIEIKTPSPVTSKETWVEGATMKFYDKDGKLVSEHELSIKGRGNSTWLQEKKPYALKFTKKVSFWGCPKHKRWVLLANACDRTMIRYDLAFHVARQTELEWTPYGDYVELNMNGEHKGTYYLCEQIRIDENRVNISEDTGTLLELDQYYDEVNKFRSIRANLPYMFKEPDEDELTPEHFNSIHTYINAIEDLLWDDKRLLSQEYLDHLDINSFIDYWFVQELSMNLECNHPRSTYCYLDKGKKLTMGPVWDFDYLTWCNEWFDTHFDNEDRTRNRAYQFTIRYALYYKRLFLDPYFRKLVQERWEMFRSKFYDVPRYIEKRRDYLLKTDLVNYPMWPHEMNADDGNLPFLDSIERIEWYYMKKLRFLDERIRKGDFSQP